MKAAKNLITILGVFLFLFTAHRLYASEDDTLLAQLRKDDWYARFSTREEKAHLNKYFDTLIGLTKNKGIDWRIRIRGIILIGETTDPRKSEVLIRMFQNPFFNAECPSIKTSIITALSNTGGGRAVIDALIDGVGDRELLVREAAIRALGKIGDERAVPRLINELKDNSFAIRLNAVMALGQIHDQSAISVLKKIAGSDHDQLIRNEAIRALEKIKS